MKAETVAYDTKLPPEVWLQCSSGCVLQDIYSLALVSRYFHDLFIPLIDEDQIIAIFFNHEYHNDWTVTLEEIQRCSRSVARVASGPDLSLRVKRWLFLGTFGIAPFVATHSDIPEIVSLGEAHTELLRGFTDTLGKCENLRVLHLTYVAVDQAMQKSILALCRLEKLVLYSCDLSEWTDAALPVHKLEMLDEGDMPELPGAEGNPLHIVSQKSLRALRINGLGVSISLLSGFAARGSKPFDNLTFLCVQLWDPFLSPFLAFLARCPQLTRLQIPKVVVFAAPTVPLPPTTIPLLHSLKSPRFLAAFFALGRPVSGMELLDGGGCRPRAAEEDKDVLQDLTDVARASPALRTLSMTLPIVHCLRVTAAIAKHWPELHALSLVLRTSSGVRRSSDTEPLEFSDSDGEESDHDWDAEDSESEESSHSDHDSTHALANTLDAEEDADKNIRVGGNVPPVPTPDVLTPGYLYKRCVPATQSLRRPRPTNIIPGPH
ncbi:hypothetical protein C8R46DRAFT_243611 [Mycena filopes]|nr:hypothetical protein C8R46DRAFT_243611 [Mycena filopes]